MRREIFFLFISSVLYEANVVEGDDLPHIDLTYTCKNGVISVITMSNGHYENLQVINKETGKGFCRRSNDTAKGLYGCIKNNTDGGTVHLLYQREKSQELVAGNKFAYFELTCDEDVETKYASFELTNPFIDRITVAPGWTTLRAKQHSGTLSLSVNQQSNLQVGDPLKLTMTITETDYKLSPQTCNAKRKTDDKSPVQIWDCTTLADANIISDSVWQPADSQKSVSINMSAFKFIDSKDVIIECFAKVCLLAMNSQECDLDNCNHVRRKRQIINQSNDVMDVPVKHASVSLKVDDPFFNRSSGLATKWYSYLVTFFFVIGARHYLQ